MENSVLFQFLEALLDFDNDVDENEEETSYNFEDEMTCRGLPNVESEKKLNLQRHLLGKKKRDCMVKNIELLKDLIRQKNEEASLKHLAQILSNVTSSEQKKLFVDELCNNTNSTINNNSFDISNPDYIPDVYFNNHDQTFGYLNISNPDYIPDVYFNNHDQTFGYLNCRSAVPQLNDEAALNSLHLHSLQDQSSMYLLSQNNRGNSTGEVYLIHKGIYYCRVLLSKFFLSKDNTILRELQSRNILNIVLNEKIDNEKNYLMNLVDRYPESFSEILFIMREDKNIILQSSIFVLLAEKSANCLYDFLARLVAEKFDKVELSKCCDFSCKDDIKVKHVIHNNNNPEDYISKKKIETFLDRYKQKS